MGRLAQTLGVARSTFPRASIVKIQKSVLLFAMAISLGFNIYLYLNASNTNATFQTQSATIDQMIVMRTNGGLLQVSTITSPEQFGSTQPHDIIGFNLGPTVTQIRIPVVINYQIKLSSEWRVEVRENRLVVVAPAVQPSLPVAVDMSKIEKFAAGRWAEFTGTAELDKLEKTLTKELASRATRSSYITFQREAARKTVLEFVRKWLITQDKWKSVRHFPITIFFADEPIESIEKIYPH